LYKPVPETLPTLLLPSPEILLIQNTTSDFIYQNQLIDLHKKILFLNSKNLHFYTDASIINSQTQNIFTGIAWILENDTQIKFNASITYAPNSTRAELAALISLFLILSSNYQIHIHLDSLSTIQTLTYSIPYNHNSQTKQNNWDIIHILNFLTKHKNINYITHKVKSYSNNTLHNIIDTLAKHGANKTEFKLNLNYFYLPTFFT
jgi:ribonuclease HI